MPEHLGGGEYDTLNAVIHTGDTVMGEGIFVVVITHGWISVRMCVCVLAGITHW